MPQYKQALAKNSSQKISIKQNTTLDSKQYSTEQFF